MYNGVPNALYSNYSSKFCSTFANPKSAILKVPLFIRMFSGLMSLWITPYLINSWKPYKISFKIKVASISGTSLLYLFYINFLKSPLLQNSYTI